MSLIPNYVPSGYKTVTPYLIVKDAGKALEFYNRAFGAETTLILKDPDNVIQHAEFKIADTVLMIAEENPKINLGPESLGGTSVVIHLYTGDAEALYEEAVKAGCREVYPLKKQFYGDISGRVKDPFGHHWIIARSVESLSPAEMQKRWQDLFKSTNQQ